MNFNNYSSGYYNNPIFDKYLYQQISNQNTYAAKQQEQPSADSGFSLDEILLQDSTALLDKVINTACSINYRLKLYHDINKSLDDQWNKLRAEVGDMSSFYPGTNMNIERKKSMITKELLGIEKQRLEHKVMCWKDLIEPTNYFVDLFHKHISQKSDQKIMRE